jgi:hypothetical protein
VLSPLLANVYLHYALDLRADRWRRCEASGDMIVVRYADDFIIGLEHESEARRFLDAIPRPKILHSWPERRFRRRHPRWEPYARIGHYGSVRRALRMSVPTAIHERHE